MRILRTVQMIDKIFPDQQAYEGNGAVFSIYGFQYKPGFEDAVSQLVCLLVLPWDLTAGCLVHYMDLRR